MLSISEPNDESGANIDACVCNEPFYDCFGLPSCKSSLILDPNFLNDALQKIWRADRKEFDRIVRDNVRKTLGV